MWSYWFSHLLNHFSFTYDDVILQRNCRSICVKVCHVLLFIYLHVLPGMGDGQTHLSYCLDARLQTRQLPVGDALWLARHKQQEQEYVLDFLVERKRVDDLWSSIKDTRYKQQKLRIMVSSLMQTDWIVTSQLTI